MYRFIRSSVSTTVLAATVTAVSGHRLVADCHGSSYKESYTNTAPPTLVDDTSVSVTPFLRNSYQPCGQVVRTADNAEFYLATTNIAHGKHRRGDSMLPSNMVTKGQTAVILIPDTMGWNSGRIRNLADYFAFAGCVAAVPRLSGVVTGAPGASLMDSEGVGQFMKTMAVNTNLKPKIESLVNFMHSQGIEKIALVGFSWGAWVAASLLASELANEFVCAALVHPNLQLEERIYGGNLAELISSVNKPILMLPTKGDPPEYRWLMKLLSYKLPTSDYIDYHHMEPGFLIRSGGSGASSSVEQACEDAMEQILDFCRLHFRLKTKDTRVRLPVHFTRESVNEDSHTHDHRTGRGISAWMGAKLDEVAEELGSITLGGIEAVRDGFSEETSTPVYTERNDTKSMKRAAQEKMSEAKNISSKVVGKVKNHMNDFYEEEEYLRNRSAEVIADATDEVKHAVTGAKKWAKQHGKKGVKQLQSLLEVKRDGGIPGGNISQQNHYDNKELYIASGYHEGDDKLYNEDHPNVTKPSGEIWNVN